MISARGDFAATYINGHVVAAGGLGECWFGEITLVFNVQSRRSGDVAWLLGNAGQPIAEVEAYNSDSDQWVAMTTPLPAPQCSASQVVYQGRLYIIGGLSLSGPTDSVSVVRSA